MFYSTDARHQKFWRVGIVRNAVFFQSFVASKAHEGPQSQLSEKRGGAEDRLPKMPANLHQRFGSQNR